MGLNESKWRNFWKHYWEHGKNFGDWDELCQTQYEALKRVLPRTDLKILEAGSGTGRVSIRLALEGAKVVLMDFSINALQISEGFARKLGVQVHPIVGSIFAIPFKDKSFDVVWNSGVLEHYSEEMQRKALAEMIRVCKIGGLVISIVPYYYAIFYRCAKRYLELRGKWKFGTEKPIKTLRHFLPTNTSLVCEFDAGHDLHLNWLCSFDFLPRIIRRPESSPYLYKWLIKRIRGYLLVSVAERTAE
ncbi:MAG: class I SAM-dependent methyltransferase [Armatimonadota bacterium]|nr:class I SAM-dependent methyltransferase [Armatimonadota bacterium]